MSGVTASIAATRPLSGARVALHVGAELEALAHAHDGDAVIADRAADERRRRPAGRARARCATPSGTTPMPAVLM